MKTIFTLLVAILISSSSFAAKYKSCDLMGMMGEEIEFSSIAIDAENYGIIYLKRGHLGGDVLYVIDRLNSEDEFIGGIDSLYLKESKSSVTTGDQELNDMLESEGQTLVDITTVPMNKVISIELMEPMEEDGMAAYGMVTYGDFEMALITNCK